MVDALLLVREDLVHVLDVRPVGVLVLEANRVEPVLLSDASRLVECDAALREEVADDFLPVLDVFHALYLRSDLISLI